MADAAAVPALNILKTRDDAVPVRLGQESGGSEPQFTVEGDQIPGWLRSGSPIGPDKLRERIEPWLTALCQSEHLSLLLGAGVSHATHRIATGQALPGMGRATFPKFQALIDAEAKRAAAASDRADFNIEDQIRTANELLRGLEILGLQEPPSLKKASDLREELKFVLREFAASLLAGENSLVTSGKERRAQAFNYLVSFLMSFASRSGTRDRLHIFTTNYDRVIEAGAEAAGLHLLDRFVGSISPVFRSSRLDVDVHYNPPGIRGEPRYLEGVARFTKLHGSLDWVDCDKAIKRMGVPFGATKLDPYLLAPGTDTSDALSLLIYPNAAKDRETAAHPYVELFRDLASAICRPNHTLIVFGHSLGDDHINRVIEDMLTIPSTHLVVMAFSDPLGRILRLFDKVGRPAQITLLIGDHVGDFVTLVERYLPKPAIDRTTFKMAELLRARWGTQPAPAPVENPPVIVAKTP
jgi:hypothetical protein